MELKIYVHLHHHSGYREFSTLKARGVYLTDDDILRES